jgi:hypothetical protein
MKNERLKMLHIPHEDLLLLLNRPPYERFMVTQYELPDDTSIRGVYYNHMLRAFDVVIESQEFDECAMGIELEAIRPKCYLVEKQENDELKITATIRD